METIYEIYPKLEHIGSRFAPFKTRKVNVDGELFKGRIAKLQGRSLMSKYIDICNGHSENNLFANINGEKKKNRLIIGKDQDDGVKSHDNISGVSERVHNTISCLGQYTDDIKSTFLREEKKKIKRKFLSTNKNHSTLARHSSFVNQKNENPETYTMKNPLFTNYSNKGMQYKTINILYKAIIDDTFRKRKKQHFEVQANRLPIVNRFSLTKRKNKFREEEFQSLKLDPLQRNKTFFGSHFLEKSKEKGVSQSKILKESLDIVPWSIQEEQS